MFYELRNVMEKIKQDTGLRSLQDIISMAIDKAQRELFPSRKAMNEQKPS